VTRSQAARMRRGDLAPAQVQQQVMQKIGGTEVSGNPFDRLPLSITAKILSHLSSQELLGNVYDVSQSFRRLAYRVAADMQEPLFCNRSPQSGTVRLAIHTGNDVTIRTLDESYSTIEIVHLLGGVPQRMQVKRLGNQQLMLRGVPEKKHQPAVCIKNDPQGGLDIYLNCGPGAAV